MSEVRYSIKDLENFTGIKAHTIRIWEQRYGLLAPNRTDTNIRYYSENDLKKILNINLLYTNGWKISRIASISESDLINESKALISKSEFDEREAVDKLIVHILDFNGPMIKKELKEFYDQSGMMKTYVKIVLPLLKRIGELWQVNTIHVTHEHFFSNIFRSFMIHRIEEIKDPSKPTESALLFLHEEEQHEISLLVSHYLLKDAGVNCYYFGQRTPAFDLEQAFEKLEPTIVVTSFVAMIGEKKFKATIKLLEAFSYKSKVYISGNQLNQLEFKLPDGISRLNSPEEFKSMIG